MKREKYLQPSRPIFSDPNIINGKRSEATHENHELNLLLSIVNEEIDSDGIKAVTISSIPTIVLLCGGGEGEKKGTEGR
jgi:hypothetical protein